MMFYGAVKEEDKCVIFGNFVPESTVKFCKCKFIIFQHKTVRYLFLLFILPFFFNVMASFNYSLHIPYVGKELFVSIFRDLILKNEFATVIETIQTINLYSKE